MNPRMMDRRSLCKSIVAIGLMGIATPLQQLAAAEPTESRESNNLPPHNHKNQDRMIVCACRPRLPNGGITFLSKPKSG